MLLHRLLLLFLVLDIVRSDSETRHHRRKVDSKLQSYISDEWILRSKDKAAPCPCSDATLCQPISGPPIRPDGEVFGFASNEIVDTNYFNWTHISTVAWASNDPVMCEAHGHGSRAVLAAPSMNLTALMDPQARTKWAMDAMNMVQSRFRDGLVFDYESPLERDSHHARAYVALVQETADMFHASNPSLQVTVCVPWSPDGIDGRNYPFLDLSRAADALYVMDYDTQSQIFGACIAGANAPFFGMVHGMQQFMSMGIDSHKLILGVPWYGYRYPCLGSTSVDDRYCPIEQVPFRGVNCSDAAGSEVAMLSIHKVLRDHDSKLRRDTYLDAPFFNTMEGDVVVQYWFEDVESFENKYAWARSAGLAGVGPYSFNDLDPQIDPQGSIECRAAIWRSFDVFFSDHARDTTIIAAS